MTAGYQWVPVQIPVGLKAPERFLPEDKSIEFLMHWKVLRGYFGPWQRVQNWTDNKY